MLLTFVAVTMIGQYQARPRVNRVWSDKATTDYVCATDA